MSPYVMKSMPFELSVRIPELEEVVVRNGRHRVVRRVLKGEVARGRCFPRANRTRTTGQL